MSSPFAAKYVTGVYLPSAALLVGTAAFKSEWLPYAIALTAVLTGAVLFSSQGMHANRCTGSQQSLTAAGGGRKVLKPDAFQEFELGEKTVLSHNTAMYVCHALSASSG